MPKPSAVASSLPAGTKGLPPSLATEVVSARGRVLGIDGKPAAGVTVRAFFISDNGGGVVANNGGGVVANNGGGVVANNGGQLIQRARYTGASGPTRLRNLAQVDSTAATTTTDERGQFELPIPAGRTANIEAVQSEGVKAILGSVASTVGVSLQLAPTGTLAGRVVVSADRKVTNFSGADVFIPGTSYLAKSAEDGRFRIDGVPAGSFRLSATKTGLGEGRTEVVTLPPGQTVQVADIELAVNSPRVLGLKPELGPPGTRVKVTGEFFGASKGATFNVRMGGVTIEKPTRVDDNEIELTIPANAKSGQIVVEVDGVPGPGLNFQYVPRFTVYVPARGLYIGKPERLDVWAWDSSDTAIAVPAVTWSVQAGQDLVTVAPDGLLTPLRTGLVKLRASWGDLVAEREVPVTQPDTMLGGHGVPLLGIPVGLAPGLDGALVVASSNILFRIASPLAQPVHFVGDASGGGSSTPNDGPPSSATFAEITAITSGPDGGLIVFDRGAIRSVDARGTVKTLGGAYGDDQEVKDGNGFSARMNFVTQATFDGRDVYFLDLGIPRRFTPSTGEVKSLVSPQLVPKCEGLAVLSDKVYVLRGGKLERIEGTGYVAASAGTGSATGANLNAFAAAGLANVGGTFYTFVDGQLGVLGTTGVRAVAGNAETGSATDGVGTLARFVASYAGSNVVALEDKLYVLDDLSIRQVDLKSGTYGVQAIAWDDPVLGVVAVLKQM